MSHRAKTTHETMGGGRGSLVLLQQHETPIVSMDISAVYDRQLEQFYLKGDFPQFYWGISVLGGGVLGERRLIHFFSSFHFFRGQSFGLFFHGWFFPPQGVSIICGGVLSARAEISRSKSLCGAAFTIFSQKVNSSNRSIRVSQRLKALASAMEASRGFIPCFFQLGNIALRSLIASYTPISEETGSKTLFGGKARGKPFPTVDLRTGRRLLRENPRCLHPESSPQCTLSLAGSFAQRWTGRVVLRRWPLSVHTFYRSCNYAACGMRDDRRWSCRRPIDPRYWVSL